LAYDMLLPLLPSPSSLLTTFIAVLIALLIASSFTHLPPLLPSCRLGWGRGGPYQSGARSYFGCQCWCHHHHHHLCRPRDRPRGAGPMTHGIPTPSRQLAPMWQGCCWRSCSRHHLPHRPMAIAVVVAAVACQRWRLQRCWQCGNKVYEDNNNNTTTTQQPTLQPTRQPTHRGDN
jgi:hypothetical protein